MGQEEAEGGDGGEDGEGGGRGCRGQGEVQHQGGAVGEEEGRQGGREGGQAGPLKIKVLKCMLSHPVIFLVLPGRFHFRQNRSR